MAKRTAKRFLIVSDNHGDLQDAEAVAAFFEFAKAWKPEIRVHLGDCFDFAALRKKASDDERRGPLAEDVMMGCEFLRRLKPTHFLRGNHDERLWDLLDIDDAKLTEYARMLADQIGDAIGDSIMLPYCKRRGVLRLGHLKCIHGFHSGVTAARQSALVYGSVVMGHVHAIDHYSIPGLERRAGRVIGCMCQLDHTYNRAMAQTLRHAHGWAYGLLFPSGDYAIYQAEKVNGSWHLPTEFVEVRSR